MLQKNKHKNGLQPIYDAPNAMDHMESSSWRMVDRMPSLPILARAEQLMGSAEYDPILLLALCMDNDILLNHTCYGERMLQLLEPMLSESPGNRELLLHEVRRSVECPRGYVCLELLRRVVGLTLEPKAETQPKKDKLLESFIQDAAKKNRRKMIYPSLLQVVYKSGARKHFLADRWMDALHVEMQDLVVRCRSKEDERWMAELCHDVLGLNWKKQIFSKKGMKAGSGPMQVCVCVAELLSNFGQMFDKFLLLQVIEFPNALQRTLKLYVDWDKKLSDVRTRTNFLQNGDQESVVQRRADVEAIRKLALGTPAAVMRLLKAMGCSSSMHRNGNDVRVIVKEGTRPLTQGEQDWKISFHFIFQIVVSSAQFRLLYHHMAELIRTKLENLAAALRMVDASDNDKQMGMETDAMRDPLHGALVGMDMHPRQNVFQVLPISL